MERLTHAGASTLSTDVSAVPHVGPVFDPKRFVTLRGRMMLAVAVVIAIPAVVAAWFLVPAGYTATAQILILGSEPYVLSADKTSTPYAQFLSTQISLMTSGTVLSKVLDSEAIRSIPELASAADAQLYLKNVIEARSFRGSEIVEVTCTMPRSQDARAVLQEVVDVYLNHIHGEAADAGRERLEMLTRERDARQLELESQLKTIRELQATMGIPMVGEIPLETGEAQFYREKLARAEENLAALQKRAADAQTQVDLVNTTIAGLSQDVPVFEFGVEDQLGTDVRVSTLRQTLAQMEAELSSTEDIERESSRQRSTQRAKYANLKAKLSEVELEARERILLSTRARLTQEAETVAEDIRQATQEVQNFNDLVAGYQGRLSTTSDQYVKLEDLKSKASETRRTLEVVRTNIATLTMERNAPARVKLASDATVPGGGPDYTNRFFAMIVACAGGAGIALLLGVVWELSDQQVRSSQDLARLTRLPVIAAIPHAQEDGVDHAADLTHQVHEKPLSSIADAYRQVMARLLYGPEPQGGLKSLAIISATRGDGKSSLTTNLGIALAQAERSVLLIDASYRRPTLENRLGLERGTGLVEVLEERVALKQAIRFTPVPGLYVLGPGLEAERLAGALASRRIAVLLEYASEKFDYVLVDTSPWLLMADTKLITPLVEGVVLVVGTNTTSLGMVRRCLRELDSVKANVVGLVLNGVRSTLGGYMQRNKELYYGYAHETPPPARGRVTLGVARDDRAPSDAEVAPGPPA